MASNSSPGPKPSPGPSGRKSWSIKSRSKSRSESRSVSFGAGVAEAPPPVNLANPVDADDENEADDNDDDDDDEGDEDEDDSLDGLPEYHLTRIPELSLALSDAERDRAFGDNQPPPSNEPSNEPGASRVVDVVEVTVTVAPADELAGFGDGADAELPEEAEVAALEVVMCMSAAIGCDKHRRAKLGTRTSSALWPSL